LNIPPRLLHHDLNINNEIKNIVPIISLAIQKGGPGKTTTAINLAAALQLEGKSVLLIDAEPQANLTQSSGINEEPQRSLYTELKKEMAGETSDLQQAIVESKTGLHVGPSCPELAGAELELVSVVENNYFCGCSSRYGIGMIIYLSITHRLSVC
jgi:cellulose biosynthesis protein BcsQ